jgi:MoaA/NifB/PqqE/SkfB family radical SAM enzyme
MYRLARTSISNFIKTIFTSSRALDSLFPLYHITPYCNLKCSYCDGLLEKTECGESQLDTAGVKKVLSIIRDRFDYIFLTGGEPFIRDDIDEILKYANALNFEKVAINTNSLLLPEHEEELKYIDDLSISLDSLNETRYDQILGVLGAGAKIVENVLKYNSLRKEYGFTLTVHCVIMPGAIGEAGRLLQFCLDKEIKICLSPQVVNYAPHPALLQNVEYEELIRKIIDLKKITNLISGSLLFYKSIHRFEPFECYPFLVPRIFPRGELLYPCRPLGEQRCRVNLLEAGTWERAANLAAESFGSLNSCQRSCRIRCYIEPSLLTRNPWAIIPEFIASSSKTGRWPLS